MIIGIDALTTAKGGEATYFHNLICALVRQSDNCRFVVWLPAEQTSQLRDLPANVQLQPVQEWLNRPPARLFYQQTVLPALLQSRGIDALLGLGNFIPYARSHYSFRRIVAVVQMLALERPPIGPPLSKKTLPRLRLQAIRHHLLRSVRHADLVIVPSHTARSLLVKDHAIPADRVKVIHHGVDRLLFHEQLRTQRAQVRAACQQLGIRRPYLLSVSSFYRYKNQLNLIKAYARLRERVTDSPQLVLIGQPLAGDYLYEVEDEISVSQLQEHIRLIYFVHPATLAYLYAGAEAVIQPSCCEIFGLAPLEGMACGAPVAVANASAVPEICGDAALYFDPFDIDDIAEKIAMLITQPEIRKEYSNRGVERSRQFSWDRVAAHTLAALKGTVVSDSALAAEIRC